MKIANDISHFFAFEIGVVYIIYRESLCTWLYLEGYIMENFLVSIGNYLPMILIGCIEVLIALFIWIYFNKNKPTKKAGSVSSTKAEKEFLHALNHQKAEAYLLIRNQDRMPVYISGDASAMLGVSLNEIQQDIFKLNRNFENNRENREFIQNYLSWDGMGNLDKIISIRDGKWYKVKVLRSEDLAYDCWTFQDVTSFQEEYERQEKKVQEALEESQSKTSFLSRMSHEIRTPLNGIMGMLSLAEKEIDENSTTMDYLNKADELSEHLLNVINDILDMSRIEAGKVELEKKAFSLRKLGDRLNAMFAKNVEAKGIHFEVKYEQMDVDYVIGDELRLSQVIINFLSNAQKFTSEGEIVVTFRQMMLVGDGVDLMIRVHDTGIGMSSEFIHKIFRPFEQENDSIQKKYGGTGLGMAITDRIVKLMHGEIVVESKEGMGSDFSVYIHMPLAKEEQVQEIEHEQEKQVQAMGETLENVNILIAEDNEINAEIAQSMLEDMHAHVTWVNNGKKAVDEFEASALYAYDVILMDVHMPVMDGREATRAIRALEREDAKKIRIYALSADAFVEDQRASVEAGMNGHFSKPVDFTLVKNTLIEDLKKGS